MEEGDDGGPTLFRLVRFWSRRWAGRASEDLTGELGHVQHILVVEAVATNAHPAGTAPVAGAYEAVTVGTVAHRLGLDHSGASRMVRDAVEAGYLARATSERDRRRASLRLTESGQELLEGARHWQRRVFEELTASWAEQDRRRFAGYLQRLADDAGA
ncbi:MarR family winged helix-turn-helix transcriptional regulator [Streptosporangium sp. NPDC002721]|uniref:MarR family winged helix-turn-helix transcriptional regulator n=1 Tax=Streptosporangium sp. NPDC002721 TaxID=3366188 RepID=UPI00367A00DA